MVCFIGILCGIDIIHMMGNTEVAIMYTILSKLVWFVEIKIALLFLKKNKNIVIRNMDWLEVFIVPVSSIFIVMAMFVPLTDEYVWAKLLASILILIVNLFTFYNYNELQEKALYQAERQFLTQQVENYAVQLQEMSKTWQQAREYRHDMKQRYLLIESYLNRNEYEKIRELYRQSVETLTEEDNLSKTGNVTFDTIVNYKAAVAQKNHINVKLDTMIPYDMKLEDVDLYSLLGNLFDNAIEAASKVDIEEREIKLLAKMSGNNLYSEIAKTGHVGCADCYDVFGDELFPLIRRIHGNTTHCGKNSDRTVQKAEKHEPTKEEKIAQLKNELDAAVKEQNFERAAELRDTIKGMEA